MILRLCVILLILGLIGCTPKVPQPQTIPEEDIISQETDTPQNAEEYEYPDSSGQLPGTENAEESGVGE
jgi:hypothetical protein